MMGLVYLIANHTLPSLMLALPLFVVSMFLVSWRNDKRQPPWLGEDIPFVSNTYLYLTDMGNFLDRAT